MWLKGYTLSNTFLTTTQRLRSPSMKGISTKHPHWVPHLKYIRNDRPICIWDCAFVRGLSIKGKRRCMFGWCTMPSQMQRTYTYCTFFTSTLFRCSSTSTTANCWPAAEHAVDRPALQLATIQRSTPLFIISRTVLLYPPPSDCGCRVHLPLCLIIQ